MKRIPGRVLAVVAASLLCGSSAFANLTPILASVSTVSAGVFKYDYTLNVDNQQQIETNDEFCLGGIAGLITTGGTATAPTGWTATASTGSCPITVGSGGNPTSSVLYKYTAGTTLAGPQNILNFTFEDVISTTGSSNTAYGGAAHQLSNNNLTFNQGFVNGPLSVTTPEPATFAMLGSGLLLAGSFRRRKKA